MILAARAEEDVDGWNERTLQVVPVVPTDRAAQLVRRLVDSRARAPANAICDVPVSPLRRAQPGRGMGETNIHLDGAIRNWVLIPITVAMFLVGVLRHNVARLLRSDAKVDLGALREAQAVIRAERVRNNSGYMQSTGFRQRRHFFCDKVRIARRPRDVPRATPRPDRASQRVDPNEPTL